MKNLIFFFLILPSIVYPQIEDYIENKEPECAKYYIIQPIVDSAIVGFPIKDNEAHDVSLMIANVVHQKLPGSLIINHLEIDKIEACNRITILLRIKEYFKMPNRRGQFKGNITLEILIFRTTEDADPYKTYKISAIGKRHWGDNTPLFNAIERLVSKIIYMVLDVSSL